jgi:hypothetical protein
MHQLNEGRQYITDHVDVKRTAFLVEDVDVGTGLWQYLGQQEYTFVYKDVGRLIEVVQDMSPGFMSWGFGSIFADLREQHPDPFPYVQEA